MMSTHASRPLVACLAMLLAMVSTPANALDTVKVADNVYALVGELGQRSPTNLGNNATFGLIVTSDGAVLIDAGATMRGAAVIEAAIAKITDRKVIVVINTGGQDHRWLANSFWVAKGARLIASKAAVDDQKARIDMQWMGLEQLVGKDGLAGTVARYADETFETARDVTIGGVKISLRHAGRAHTPGDLFVWLPDQEIVFAGDIVFHDRMLGILPAPLSTSADWIKAYDAMAALQPKIVVPGHGRPAGLEQSMADTRDYLAALRDGVKGVLDRKGDMTAAAKIDQSRFSRLTGADQLAGRNAQAVFAEMEFD
jgi:glyoxylase-like metal-dependent hydrolase (beta-lactamase superfamily II)